MLKKTLLIVLLGVICMGGSSGGDGPGPGVPSASDATAALGGGGASFGPPSPFGGEVIGGIPGGVPTDSGFLSFGVPAPVAVGPPTPPGFSIGEQGVNAPTTTSQIGFPVQSFAKMGLMQLAQQLAIPQLAQVSPMLAKAAGAPPALGLFSGLVDFAMNPPQNAEQAFAQLGASIANAAMFGVFGIPAMAEGDVSTMGIGGPSPFEPVAQQMMQQGGMGPAAAPQQAGVAPPAPAPPPQYGLSPQPFGWYGMKRVGQPWVSPPSGAFGNYGGMKRVGA